MPQTKRVALCMSNKKFEKLNFKELCRVFLKEGFEVFKLDLNVSLEKQEPFCVLLHKLTDTIVAANNGDFKNTIHLQSIEKYIEEHPQLVVIDPLQNIRKLLDRYVTYTTISETNLHKFGIFTPNFCEIVSSDINEIKSKLETNNITYPFLCKAIPGHGSTESHQMSIIFNEEGLTDCGIPSVAQNFIKHNAILYKLFTVGEKYAFVTRPSLKNYKACDQKTIFFNSSTISKASSESELTKLDPDDAVEQSKPDEKIFQIIAKSLCEAFGMDLLGIDVIIENKTGKYAIIDVNAYPGYDGYPNFFEDLIDCIKKKL